MYIACPLLKHAFGLDLHRCENGIMTQKQWRDLTSLPCTVKCTTVLRNISNIFFKVKILELEKCKKVIKSLESKFTMWSST